jgi:thioredoxin-dependent peroxiredoxin
MPSTLPTVGDVAPQFTLPDASGTKTSLASLLGDVVVLYFYPEDNSPACTDQACGFSDAAASLATSGVRVVGISPDSVESHREFISQRSLRITLLSDGPGKDGVPGVARAYGAWGEKSLYGKVYTGLIRSTFVIGKDGVILAAYRNVRAKGHVQRILDELPALLGSGAAHSATKPGAKRGFTPARPSSTKNAGRSAAKGSVKAGAKTSARAATKAGVKAGTKARAKAGTKNASGKKN